RFQIGLRGRSARQQRRYRPDAGEDPRSQIEGQWDAARADHRRGDAERTHAADERACRNIRAGCERPAYDAEISANRLDTLFRRRGISWPDGGPRKRWTPESIKLTWPSGEAGHPRPTLIRPINRSAMLGPSSMTIP